MVLVRKLALVGECLLFAHWPLERAAALAGALRGPALVPPRAPLRVLEEVGGGGGGGSDAAAAAGASSIASGEVVLFVAGDARVSVKVEVNGVAKRVDVALFGGPGEVRPCADATRHTERIRADATQDRTHAHIGTTGSVLNAERNGRRARES